jgi:hypothetical protein
MFINQETNNRIRIATTNLPLRVSLHVLVAFAICRLLSVVVRTPTPVTFGYECVLVFVQVNHKPVCISAKGATPNTSWTVICQFSHYRAL